MKIVYSTDKSVSTVVIDMRDIVVRNGFTDEIDIKDLYKYVQIIDLKEIFPKELLERYSIPVLTSNLFWHRFDDMPILDRDIIMGKYIKYFRYLSYKFGLKSLHRLSYYQELAEYSSIGGIQMTALEDEKDLVKQKIMKNRIKNGAIGPDSVILSIPVWKHSEQCISVFLNPYTNKLKYAYEGIIPDTKAGENLRENAQQMATKGFFKYPNKENEDDYTL